ncbi:protein of unknown function [Amycolatopsis marina]|uniref:DUF397 domain-containing protein n=1 Tax=Amycolatopsis marina TaxID=490629 RepID=A0A1I0Y1P5_9PSEU|nr:DUF397 domain-containing protein [Amycolatopsis marina]SFB07142.1 protein of unknown function [Amycolatopsis marina]
MNKPEPGGVAWRTSSYSTNGGNCVEVGWQTSSHSGNGGDCVEVGWQTSSHSGNGGNCVEVGHRPDEVLVRDTKDRSGGTLTVPHAPWQALLTQVR